MRIFFSPFSLLYDLATRLRNYFYDKNILKIYNLEKPVISIGNLTMGGTGKTPVAVHLIEWCLQQNIKVGVVSRGYKSQVSGVAKLPSLPAAEIYGDEASMVKTKFNDIQFYIGADRVAAAKEIMAQENVDLVLADDGFQHRRLGRQLDILVIDATEPIANYKVIPLGRARENIHSLSRADFIILNKINLVEKAHVAKLREYIATIQQLNGVSQTIIEATYFAAKVTQLATGLPQEIKKGACVVLMSGIGRPETFTKLLEGQFTIKEHLAFSDHYKFTNEDVQYAVKKIKEVGAEKILVTQKDAIKLKALVSDQSLFAVVDIGLQFSSNVDLLYSKIKTLK